MNQAPDPNRYDGARIKAALHLLHHYEKSEPLRKAFSRAVRVEQLNEREALTLASAVNLPPIVVKYPSK